MAEDLVFFCNGKKIIEKGLDPNLTLNVYLRTKLRLCGTKQGCGTGGCGACTVMLSTLDPHTKEISHQSVVACLMPVALLHGKAITTIEGIGNCRTRLHAVQECLALSHGSQCGFCSPGMVMSMYTLLRNNPKPEVEDVLRCLEGNLCRCTGYRSILDGFKSFCGKENCCQMSGEKSCQTSSETNPKKVGGEGGEEGARSIYDPSQEPIFPPELLTDADKYSRTVTFKKGRCTWVIASTLEELLKLKANNPSAQLAMGNTIMSCQRLNEGVQFPFLISPGRGIRELNQVTTSDLGVTVGSGVTISQLEKQLKSLVATLPEHKTRSLSAMLGIMEWFGGQQIRNMATIGASVAVPSGMLDLGVVLMATNTTVDLAKAGGIRRTVPLNMAFYPARNQTVIGLDEILVSIFIPFNSENEYVFSHKVAEVHHNSRAAISCGFRVTINAADQMVKDLCLAFGAMGGPAVVAQKTCDSLVGQLWNQSLLQDAIQSITAEIKPGSHPNGISAEYRSTLMATCFLRFYVKVSQQLDNQQGLTGVYGKGRLADPSLQASYNSNEPISTQIYQPPPLDQPAADPLGRPIIHQSALQQCSGEAVYTEDIPLAEGELHVAMVVSSRARAKIISVDPSKALALEGVEAYITHTDVPGKNTLTDDEKSEIFASKEVHCIGQPIGAVVATSHVLAVRAARLVDVQYEDVQPVILTIRDAIKEGTFTSETVFRHGDLEAGFSQSDGILEGEFEVGGQDHFYMETHTCVVRPGEDEEVEIFAASQSLNHVQIGAAVALGVPRNRVACFTKRIGGGFGGKEEPIRQYLACVIAAKKLQRPARLRLERSADMLITGGRHPFLAKYRVGYHSDGRISAMDVQLYADGGYLFGTSLWVTRCSMLVFESLYHIPGFRLAGHPCRTNKPLNTAVRGFGSPQGLSVMEHIVSEIGAATGVPQKQVREVNFKPEGVSVLEGANPMEMDIFHEIWSTCLRQSDYDKRLEAVEEFNRTNHWKKRGISILPTRHGAGMNTFLNQGAALVHIYTDGSVLVNHGGIEMGQGLYTKLVQVACRVLGVPINKVHTSATAIDKVPNTTNTGGSIGTDLFGGAVKIACEILNERLEPYRTAKPEGSWEDWVQDAYMDRVSLSTTGYYRKPGVTFDWTTCTGNPYHYFTMGAAVTEVEVDCLTGEHQVLRTDIVMDVGQSINPAIDIGQIEGAFLQGYGYFTSEKMRFSPEGAMLSDGPSTYKIPAMRDAPKEFNVTLLRNMRTKEDHLYSSKAIGEPPFFLGATAFFAIKHALMSARADNGAEGLFKFNAPATVENIRMSCGDVGTTA